MLQNQVESLTFNTKGNIRAWSISETSLLRGSQQEVWLELGLECVLRPAVSRPVRLGIGPPFGAHEQILSFSSFSFDSYFVVLPRALSLRGGRVCSLQCNRWLVRSLTTNNHTLLSHLRLCSLSVASYDSQGLRWKYSNPPPHGECSGSMETGQRLPDAEMQLRSHAFPSGPPKLLCLLNLVCAWQPVYWPGSALDYRIIIARFPAEAWDLFSTMSRAALGFNHPIERELQPFSPRTPWSSCEVDHTPLTGADVRNASTYISTETRLVSSTSCSLRDWTSSRTWAGLIWLR
jgi:hypothetical protein